MSEMLEISRQEPENKSMDYKFLREEGIKYIQELSSKIWTDYNVHDPGITILEALCYAITDLGYRASFPIKDIIAIEDANYEEDKIKNFYKAEQILPSAPLNINDYRKLLMDIQIEVNIPGLVETELVGVKNAWVKKSDQAEKEFYFHESKGTLSFDQDPDYPPSDQSTMQAGHLYEVVLEFSDSDFFDDLNHNTIDGYLTIYDNPDDTNLEGIIVSVDITLPRWDSTDIDWTDIAGLRSKIQKMNIQFQNRPNNYKLDAIINEKFEITLVGTITEAGIDNDIKKEVLEALTNKINSYIFNETNNDSLIYIYQQKINIIQSILEKVKATLNSNRNLCDDFNKISALKVEEIGICADLQTEPDSDLENLQAQVYYEIGKFLSPSVNFHSLSEMLDLCKSNESYLITEIDKTNKTVTVNKDLTEKLTQGDKVSIINSVSNVGNYTVNKITENSLKSDYTDIEFIEDIPSDVITEGELLSFTVINKDRCLTIDQIFEGPLLRHGFIDTCELEKSELMEEIHVSDLIQIIMDIPGIIAVKNLEIASYPEDPKYDTELKSVKWVLDLTSEDNYVPRLSIDKSTVIFYKDQIPYKAHKKEVEDIIDELQGIDRAQKLVPPIIYPKVPKGEYKKIKDYTSIQEEFPLTYGVGYEGIPNLSNLSENNQQRRIAQSRQLKGYLMFFDQLLANYLSQLANVKDLFSMNAKKDEFGDFEVGRTYYTQSLSKIVNDSDPLYINKYGHEAELELIAENESLFNVRRNKFLDHLLARFAETFTDYALLMTRLSGNKAPREIIDDKLNFLNKFPDISSNRGLAFNYKYQGKIWHIDNKSGLEKRSSLLMGVAPKQPDSLIFSSDFVINSVGNLEEILISADSKLLLRGMQNYDSKEKAKEVIELIIINGLQKDKYEVLTNENGKYFNLKCDEEIIATSEKTNYGDIDEAYKDIKSLINLCENEFYNNHESNRNNLTPPIDKYFNVKLPEDIIDDEGYLQVEIALYAKPFIPNEENIKLLNGSFQIKLEEGETSDDIDIQKNAKEFIWKTIISGIIPDYYIFDNLETEVEDEYLYVFRITNREGNVLATSVASDFNKILTNYINEINGADEPDSVKKAFVRIAGVVENAGYYPIESSTHNESNVTIHINKDNKIPVKTTKGNLSLTEAYVCEINPSEHAININMDIKDVIDEYCLFALINNSIETKLYSIKEFSFGDNKTSIIAKENLSADTTLNRLVIYKTYPYSLDEENSAFSIDEDISGKYSSGDILTMWEDESKIKEFTIKSIVRYGDKTQVIVKDKIEQDPRGRISFTKIYQQVRIDILSIPPEEKDKNAFTIKGCEDIKARDEMIRFIKEKFIEKEGLHLIEHVLLRPKFNEGRIAALTEGLADNGSIQFNKSLPLIIIDAESEIVGVEGDIASEFYNDPDIDKISIKLAGYTIEINLEYISYSSEENATIIDLESLFPDEIKGSEETIYLTYLLNVEIEGIHEANQRILTSDTNALILNPGDTLSIVDSLDNTNDGQYTVSSTDNDGILIELELLQDSFLPVFLSGDCTSYNLTNPYTSIATIVLPYWPERFNNMDFRNFFDKTLRLEAPSHDLLKICWVNPMHMEDFERAYKKWLITLNNKQSTKLELSDSLNRFIEAIDNLRNVYPVGTLYDSKEHQTLKNTIILDNTMLGSF